VERIGKYLPSPLDIDTELQEEVVLRDYEIGEATEGDHPGQKVIPIEMAGQSFSALLGTEGESQALRKSLVELKKLKKSRPPLFGLMHYERCRLMFQPLSTFKGELDYITISKENINKATLLKAMSFK
jgi:hypothetical protein